MIFTRTATITLCLFSFGILSLSGCQLGDPNQIVGEKDANVEGIHTLAEVTTSGGMCPEGPCESLVSLDSDGAWTVTSFGKIKDHGQMKNKDLVALEKAIDAADFSSLELQPEGYGCPTAYDGRMNSYIFYKSNKETIEVNSCEYKLGEGFAPVELLNKELQKAKL